MGAGIRIVVGLLDGKALVDRLLVGIVQREIFRNGDMLRAAFHAIPARRAGYGYRAVDDAHSLLYGALLVLGKRPEVAHERRVFVQLF